MVTGILVEALGLVGAIGFAICAVPQALSTYRKGSARDLSLPFLLLWALGEGCMLSYVLLTSLDPYLIGNYIANGLCLLVILRYRLWPRGERCEREDREEREDIT